VKAKRLENQIVKDLNTVLLARWHWHSFGNGIDRRWYAKYGFETIRNVAISEFFSLV
jgi:hypothetical protein